MRILDTLFIIVLSILVTVIALVGGLLTVIGVQCLNSTTHTTALISIVTGVLIVGLSMFCFPKEQWSIILWDLHGWWNRYTNRVTEESQDLPLIQTGYDTVKAEPKMYTQEEMDDAIYAAKDEVAKHWSDEAIRLGLVVANQNQDIELLKANLKAMTEHAEFFKSLQNQAMGLVDTIRSRANATASDLEASREREMKLHRELTIAKLTNEVNEVTTDNRNPEVQEKINSVKNQILDILDDASKKTAGVCDEQRASFMSLVKLARVKLDGIHTMWIKNRI